MDPLTHGLLGAGIGWIIGGKKLGRWSALVGALAGISPDIDHFVSSDTDPLAYVKYHRHFTHSFLFSPIGALISTLPLLFSHRFRSQWRILWLCAWPAYLSHLLLDACTTYGTQLYLPFSSARAGWDLISIVDPIFTCVILFTLLSSLQTRRRRDVAVGLSFCLAYLGFGAVQRQRAAAIQEHLVNVRGHHREQWEIMPTLANQFVWRSLYLADGALHSDRIRVGLFSAGQYREGTSLPQMTSHTLTPFETQGNQELGAFDRFFWFSSGWLARDPDDPSLIGDMRYTLNTDAFDPIWGIRFSETNSVVGVEWVVRTQERKLHLGELWDELMGRDPRYRSP